jgi:uncharacterized protein YciI
MFHAKHQRLNVLFFGVARFRPGVQAQHEALKSAFSTHMMQPLSPRIRLAGAILDASGGQSGVFMLLEADSIGAVRRFLKDSPYVQANLYERIEIDALQLEVGHV